MRAVGSSLKKIEDYLKGKETAKALKRTPGALRQKARYLGISIGHLRRSKKRKQRTSLQASRPLSGVRGQGGSFIDCMP